MFVCYRYSYESNLLFQIGIDLAESIALMLDIFSAQLLQTVQLLQQFHIVVVVRFQLFILQRQLLPIGGQLAERRRIGSHFETPLDEYYEDLMIVWLAATR